MVRGWGGVFPKARQRHVIGYFMHKFAGMVGVRRLSLAATLPSQTKKERARPRDLVPRVWVYPVSV